MDLLALSINGSYFSDVNTSQEDQFYFEQPRLIQIDEVTPVSVVTLDSQPITADRGPHKICKKKNKKKYDFHTKKRKKSHKNNQLNNDVFSSTEDEKILSLVLELGPRFQLIAKYFPDRSLNAIKNRYYKYLRYRWDGILGSNYQHLNQRIDSPQMESDDLLEFVGQMNLFPEVTKILQNFVQKINQSFI